MPGCAQAPAIPRRCVILVERFQNSNHLRRLETSPISDPKAQRPNEQFHGIGRLGHHCGDVALAAAHPIVPPDCRLATSSGGRYRQLSQRWLAPFPLDRLAPDFSRNCISLVRHMTLLDVAQPSLDTTPG
jgi:hypothetical protein